jgi:FkbM family methyltransferase
LSAEEERGGPGALVWHFSDDPADLQAVRRRSSGWRPENLRKEFTPATVIDVGAAHGTPSLYAAFPDAHHVLIDPLVEYEESLRHLAGRLGGEYLLVAAGDEEGSATVRIDAARLWRSSLLESLDPAIDEEQREDAVTTLDALQRRKRWKPPFGVKIDTEGFEQKVIQGATRLLDDTQFVIAEVSVMKRFEASYTFAGFISKMDSLGFVVCDVLDGMKPRLNGQVVFADLLFKRVRPAGS